MAALNTFRSNWLRGVFLLCSVLLIVACGGSDSTESTSSNDAQTATAPAGDGASSSATSAPQASSSGGGRTVEAEEALDQLVELYKEMLAVLAGVTDEASARAAADDISRISVKFSDLDAIMEDLSQEEIMSAVLSGRLGNFGEELSKELIRLSSDPEIFRYLSEAFENLN